MKILIIEDNKHLNENLIFLLKNNKFLAEGVHTAEEALQKLLNFSYDIIILDINLPKMSGKEFLVEFKKYKKNSLILVLSSNSMLQDKLELFDLGVDDYMTKPFEIEELVARLKVLGKRIEKNTFKEKIKIGNITIDTSAKKVYLRQKEIILTYKEYLIVELLSKFRGQAKQKNEIMEYVWGENEENLDLDSKTLEAHIYAIRKKLGKDFIKTVKLVGYIIE